MNYQQAVGDGQARNLDTILDAERKFHIQRALSEACYWGRAIEKNQKKPSDQYWIEKLSTGTASLDDLKKFFSTYQINRAPWRFDKVVAEVNDRHKEQNWRTTTEVAKLAVSLAKALGTSKDGKALQDGDRTSAASKVAMFARPQDDVFIWDRLARVALGVRLVRQGGVGKAIIYKANGRHGYSKFHEHCALELEAERATYDFSKAVGDFIEFTNFTRCGQIGKDFAERTYFERRLFDKLLVCEGVRIEELQKAKK